MFSKKLSEMLQSAKELSDKCINDPNEYIRILAILLDSVANRGSFNIEKLKSIPSFSRALEEMSEQLSREPINFALR
jgi:hypothetical protein